MSKPHTRFKKSLVLPDLDKLAKETELVQRKSTKFSPSVFLISLMSAVYSGKASLNNIAARLKLSLEGMSRQSLHERFSSKSTNFLLSVLHSLIEQRLERVRATLQNAELKRIIVEDSTSLGMPKKNADNFPAHGNSHGKTAGVKIDFAYDILSGQCVMHSVEKATEQDKTIGKEAVSFVETGDLYLRDMGYYCTSEFIYLEEQGAHWLSRLPLNCNASSLEGVELEELLKKSKKALIDKEIILGKEVHKCRLIAKRATPEAAEKKKEELREKANKKNKEASEKSLIRAEWHIAVTSLSAEQATAQELFILYGSRWSIELQFRGLKQSLNLEDALNRVTKEDHHLALIIAAMITHQLHSKIWNQYEVLLAQKKKNLSLEKLMSNFTIFLGTLKYWEDIRDYEPDYRHISYDTRKRKPKISKGYEVLT